MNVLEALDDPELFAPYFTGDSWTAWRAYLAALFALAPSDAGGLYLAATGRSNWPVTPFGESALIVGRRGGKSRVLALIAVVLACFRDYAQYLAPGEVATIAVLAANRPQARTIFRFVSGLLKAVPLLSKMIAEETGEQITLTNRVVIEIGTASFRTTRGYSFAAVLCDEIAFWRSDENSANPDIEILRALRPGMASIPGAMLLLASSPYAKRGELYHAYRRHFGKDDARVLVWKADTAMMNPLIDAAIIEEAYEADPKAARAEYGAEFRDDLADFITVEAIDAVTALGRYELPPQPGQTYHSFCDPSGGISDSMTLAIGHQEGDRGVLDFLLEIRPPFDPDQAVAQCAAALNRFGVARVVGDHFAGLWPVARFSAHGIAFEQSARPKSALYGDFLPLANAQRIELLDHPRLAAQFVALERRTGRSGKDSIAEPPGAHDDLCNAVSGVLVGLDLDRRPALIRKERMLDNDGQALPLPSRALIVFAVVGTDKRGMMAVVYAARPLPDGSGVALFILDFDVEPLRARQFRDIAQRLLEFSASCGGSDAMAFAPADLVRHAEAEGLPVAAIPDDMIAEQRLLSAAHHLASGRVKICEPALAKARATTFGAALDIRAGEDVDGALSAALLLTIGMALDVD